MSYGVTVAQMFLEHLDKVRIFIRQQTFPFWRGIYNQKTGDSTMSRYKIGGNFRCWKKGDLLEKYEYNRLPIEMKVGCEEIPDEVPAPVAEVAVPSRFTSKKVVESDNVS